MNLLQIVTETFKKLYGFLIGIKRDWPINPNDDTQNYPFCRLQLVVETFGHSTK